MSFWVDYKKAVLGVETIETEDGLISYKISGELCYIDVIYVPPEKRKLGIASKLADQVSEIARGLGCTDLHAQVWTGAQDATLSLKVILAYGFRVVHAENNRIICMKSLRGGQDE